MAPVTRSNDDTPALSDEQPDEDIDSGIEDVDGQSESSIQEFLQPLQETADRVSQQVEEFARSLHKFKNYQARNDKELWLSASVLLDDYSKSAVTRLNHTSSQRSKAFSHRQSLGDNDAQIDKLQLEVDLWSLTQDLLVPLSPKEKAGVAHAQSGQLSELHRYSSNLDIWNAFLDSDSTAQSYEKILVWLYERAENTSPAITNVIADLTAESERGDGSWSAGPLFTKNTIKKQKRDRAWPLPLDPSNPGLSASLRRQYDGAKVVTQLDPDAPNREDALLESQDEYHERAAWQTCWELLRRGHKISDVCAWWDERNEQWRSLLLYGCDPTSGESATSPFSRMLNLATNPEWFNLCKALSDNEGIADPFQRAIYGLLCGNASAPVDVCNTIDDLLIVKFNACLISHYQAYLKAYSDRLADPSKSTYRVHVLDKPDVRRLAKICSDELQQPHKLIQLTLMGDDWQTFFVDMGRASAQVAYADGGSEFNHLMKKDETAPVDQALQLTAQSEDSVRIVAHLQLLFQALGLLKASSEQEQYQLENNTVNYIGWLEKEKKWTLLPIYACKLSSTRYQHVLGTILINITNEKERESQIRLLKKYNIDVAEVIYGIASLSQFKMMMKFKSPKFNIKTTRFTERPGSGNSIQIKIRADFLGGKPSEEDDKLIQAVEWYRFVDAENWGSACHHITNLYYYWLSSGNLEAVHELRERISLAQISLSAVGMNLLYADESQDEADEVNGDSPEIVHPLMQATTGRTGLYNKSLSWLHIERLVDAMIQLEDWQALADEVDAARNEPSLLRALKKDLNQSLEVTIAAIEPLFNPEFLRQPNDPDEERILLAIRDYYLPECILAYNSVLYFAGHSLSRTWLVQCMDLAQRIAQNANMTDAFRDGGRMRELMNVLAVDSQALLNASEQSKNKGKSNKKDRDISMWDVEWREDGMELDLDGVD